MRDTRRIRTAIAAALAVFAWPWPVAAQAGERPVDTLPLCGAAKPERACRVEVDLVDPKSGITVKVANDTTVIVILTRKSPFDSCRTEVKREELPDPSVAASLLALFTKMATGGAVRTSGVDPRVAPPQMTDLDRRLTNVMVAAAQVKDAAETVQKLHASTLDRLMAFYEHKFLEDGLPEAEMRVTFERERGAQFEAVSRTAASTLPANAVIESEYRGIVADYAAYLAAGNVHVPSFDARIGEVRSSCDALGAALAALDTSRSKFRAALAYLERLKDPRFEQRFPIRRDRNARVSGSIACTHEGTGKTTVEPPVLYTVVFGSTPHFALSGGFIYSWSPRDNIDIQSVAGGRRDSTITAPYEQVVNDRQTHQFVPFSFLNIRLGDPIYWRGRPWTFNLAPGFGVNSISGVTGAEYFAGASIGIGNVFLAGGWHWGHRASPANGYREGDRVPSSLGDVPVKTSWRKPAGAIAVSYRVPLK